MSCEKPNYRVSVGRDNLFPHSYPQEHFQELICCSNSLYSALKLTLVGIQILRLFFFQCFEIIVKNNISVSVVLSQSSRNQCLLSKSLDNISNFQKHFPTFETSVLIKINS